MLLTRVKLGIAASLCGLDKSFSFFQPSSKLGLTQWGGNFTVCVYFIYCSPAPFSLAVKGISEYTESLAVTMSQMYLDITHFIYSSTAVADGFIFALYCDTIRYTGE